MEQAIRLKKLTPLIESSISFYLSWFGPWGLELQSALPMLGITLFIVIYIVFLVDSILSRL